MTPTAYGIATQSIILPGIEVMVAQSFTPLMDLRVGLVTNQTGRTIAGQRTIDVLANATNVLLVAIFTPEHGLGSDREGQIESGLDAQTGLPVHSLYGASRRPQRAILAGLDAVVIDVQDAGVRFYTYITTMAYVMEEAARAHLRVIVLDRPNPIGAAGVRGPVLERDLRSFTGYFAMPVQHGMTLGELALMFNSEEHMGVDLTVVPMHGYRRSSWYDETGLVWVNPSPNLRSVEQAILYPGVALIEGTNVSVGRGTPNPFEVVGAPWIDAAALARYLTARDISGVRFSPASFTPTADRYAQSVCQGVCVRLADRATLNASRLGIELAVALRQLYPRNFAVRDMLSLVGSRDTVAAIEAGDDPAAIDARWQPAVHAFEAMRAKYLIY
jgi:uncharacterized protein YbbC (DUF1343 family)